MTTSTNTPTLIAEEPPDKKSGGGLGTSPIGLWLTALRDHPGAWHRFPETITSSIATVIKQGKGYGAGEGEFDAVSRTAEQPGQFVLYARYVGAVSE